jgi:hypothetical protein
MANETLRVSRMFHPLPVCLPLLPVQAQDLLRASASETVAAGAVVSTPVRQMSPAAAVVVVFQTISFCTLHPHKFLLHCLQTHP